MAQGRGHRRGPRALTRSVVAACGRGLKAIVIIVLATFALWLWRPELQPMELPLGQFREGDPLFNEVPRQSCHAGATPRQHEGVIRIGFVRVVDVIVRGPVHLVDDCLLRPSGGRERASDAFVSLMMGAPRGDDFLVDLGRESVEGDILGD